MGDWRDQPVSEEPSYSWLDPIAYASAISGLTADRFLPASARAKLDTLKALSYAELRGMPMAAVLSPYRGDVRSDIARVNEKRILRGDRGLTSEEVLAAAEALSGRRYLPDNRRWWDLPGNFVRDLTALVLTLPALPGMMVSDLFNIHRIPQLAYEGVRKRKSWGDIPEVFADLPLIRWVPGTFVGGRIFKPEELVSHPLFTVLDVWPYLYLKAARSPQWRLYEQRRREMQEEVAKRVEKEPLERLVRGEKLSVENLRRAFEDPRFKEDEDLHSVSGGGLEDWEASVGRSVLLGMLSQHPEYRRRSPVSVWARYDENLQPAPWAKDVDRFVAVFTSTPLGRRFADWYRAAFGWRARSTAKAIGVATNMLNKLAAQRELGLVPEEVLEGRQPPRSDLEFQAVLTHIQDSFAESGLPLERQIELVDQARVRGMRAAENELEEKFLERIRQYNDDFAEHTARTFGTKYGIVPNPYGDKLRESVSLAEQSLRASKPGESIGVSEPDLTVRIADREVRLRRVEGSESLARVYFGEKWNQIVSWKPGKEALPINRAYETWRALTSQLDDVAKERAEALENLRVAHEQFKELMSFERNHEKGVRKLLKDMDRLAGKPTLSQLEWFESRWGDVAERYPALVSYVRRVTELARRVIQHEEAMFMPVLERFNAALASAVDTTKVNISNLDSQVSRAVLLHEAIANVRRAPSLERLIELQDLLRALEDSWPADERPVFWNHLKQAVDNWVIASLPDPARIQVRQLVLQLQDVLKNHIRKDDISTDTLQRLQGVIRQLEILAQDPAGFGTGKAAEDKWKLLNNSLEETVSSLPMPPDVAAQLRGTIDLVRENIAQYLYAPTEAARSAADMVHAHRVGRFMVDTRYAEIVAKAAEEWENLTKAVASDSPQTLTAKGIAGPRVIEKVRDLVYRKLLDTEALAERQRKRAKRREETSELTEEDQQLAAGDELSGRFETEEDYDAALGEETLRLLSEQSTTTFLPDGKIAKFDDPISRLVVEALKFGSAEVRRAAEQRSIMQERIALAFGDVLPGGADFERVSALLAEAKQAAKRVAENPEIARQDNFFLEDQPGSVLLEASETMFRRLAMTPSDIAIELGVPKDLVVSLLDRIRAPGDVGLGQLALKLEEYQGVGADMPTHVFIDPATDKPSERSLNVVRALVTAAQAGWGLEKTTLFLGLWADDVYVSRRVEHAPAMVKLLQQVDVVLNEFRNKEGVAIKLAAETRGSGRLQNVVLRESGEAAELADELIDALVSNETAEALLRKARAGVGFEKTRTGLRVDNLVELIRAAYGYGLGGEDIAALLSIDPAKMIDFNRQWKRVNNKASKGAVDAAFARESLTRLSGILDSMVRDLAEHSATFETWGHRELGELASMLNEMATERVGEYGRMLPYQQVRSFVGSVLKTLRQDYGLGDLLRSTDYKTRSALHVVNAAMAAKSPKISYLLSGGAAAIIGRALSQLDVERWPDAVAAGREMLDVVKQYQEVARKAEEGRYPLVGKDVMAIRGELAKFLPAAAVWNDMMAFTNARLSRIWEKEKPKYWTVEKAAESLKRLTVRTSAIPEWGGTERVNQRLNALKEILGVAENAKERAIKEARLEARIKAVAALYERLTTPRLVKIGHGYALKGVPDQVMDQVQELSREMLRLYLTLQSVGPLRDLGAVYEMAIELPDTIASADLIRRIPQSEAWRVERVRMEPDNEIGRFRLKDEYSLENIASKFFSGPEEYEAFRREMEGEKLSQGLSAFELRQEKQKLGIREKPDEDAPYVWLIRFNTLELEKWLKQIDQGMAAAVPEWIIPPFQRRAIARDAAIVIRDLIRDGVLEEGLYVPNKPSYNAFADLSAMKILSTKVQPDHVRERTYNFSPTRVSDGYLAMRASSADLAQKKVISIALQEIGEFFGQSMDDLVQAYRPVAERLMFESPEPGLTIPEMVDRAIRERFGVYTPEKYLGSERAQLPGFMPAGSEKRMVPLEVLRVLDLIHGDPLGKHIPILTPAINLFRIAALGLAPRFAVNNAIGGMILLTANDPTNILSLPKALRLMRQLREGSVIIEGFETGFGAVSVPAEVIRYLEDGGPSEKMMAFYQMLAGYKAGKLFEKARQLGTRGWQGVKWVARKNFELNQWFDDLYRVAALINHLEKRGLTVPDVPGSYFKQLTPELVPAYLEAINSANSILQDWSAITPTERTVLRSVFPFYAWMRTILRYIWGLPRDHPFAVGILSSAIGAELDDFMQGSPWLLRSYLFPFGTNDGVGLAIDTSGLNPFKDVANYFTIAGLVGQANPLFAAVMEAVGLDAMTGHADLWPDLDVDPATGRLTVKSNKTLLGSTIQSLIPQTRALEAWFDTDRYRIMRKRDPDAANRFLLSSLGVWFPFRKVDQVERVINYAVAQVRTMEQRRQRAKDVAEPERLRQLPFGRVDERVLRILERFESG